MVDGSVSSQLATAHRTGDYSYRVPTPPKIVVPPPTLNADALPDVTLGALRQQGFLSDLNHGSHVKSNVLIEWKYEHRRFAQRIIPPVWLGPMTAARDIDFLRENGITMLLGVRPGNAFQAKVYASTVQLAQKLGLHYETIEAANNQELIATFPYATRLIDQHLRRVHEAQQSGIEGAPLTGRVLVFCESGNDRSAGLVAAYLMESYEDVNHIKAIQMCQAQRFCVSFDDRMKSTLESYWDILVARRMVGESGGATHPTARDGNGVNGTYGNGANGTYGMISMENHRQGMITRAKRKLEIDDDGDGDAVMSGAKDDDIARFGGRSFAPFLDMEEAE
ncbi:hypothetical protein LTR66_001292 [Elasticomyces elasticus]|nr:hypothetical protein LTR66_001292 [Elasticomyces elasticus]